MKDPELTGIQRRDKALDEHRYPPEQAALKHGIWPFVKARTLCCDQCMLPRIFGEDCPEYREGAECVFLERRGRELRDLIMGLEHIQPQDAELVADYIYHCQLLELVQAVMAGLGPLRVTKKSKQQTMDMRPLLANRYLAWSRHRRQLAVELGLGPGARAKMKQTAAGSKMAAMIMKLDEEAHGDN